MPPPDPSAAHDPAADQLREACGVFGIYAPGQQAAQYTYLGLFALQHRGQEAAGMSVSDGSEVVTLKDTGLVTKVFDDRLLQGLPGHLAIGHVRYSTTGSSVWQNAQPVVRGAAGHQIALGHNGNLVNTAELAAELGMLPGTGDVTSDSDLVVELLARELAGDDDHHGDDRDVERALVTVLPRLRGAFSIVCMDEAHVVGVRDPNGFRPLCLGRLDSGGWVLASESPALDIVGAHFVRELDPGEMVVIDATGPRSVRPFPDSLIQPSLCLFEFVYFARPDSRLYGRNVHRARVRMGELLAEQAPADADMVMGVPESGVPAAEGFALRSGIPAGHGLVKNRYIGRSFIAPSQELHAAVRMKLNPIRENVEGKRIVVVDDTIVRGTTQQAIVRMLREAGAVEVHLRITAPPVRWSCFYGIDTGNRQELLAANLEVGEIADYLGVDSLAYLMLDRLYDATGAVNAGFCDACFTGTYPVEVPVTLGKGMLEAEPDRHAIEAAAPIPSSVAGQLGFDS